MGEVPIQLDHVCKRFKLYRDPISGPVKEYLFFWKRHHYYQEIMAVKDVSLEVKRGEVVGLIGPNGAGKTTLLKMIAGLLPVDGGEIEIHGKVTALLALGVGVHPEFTGRENILYGGMLLGMSKAEVLRKMPAIIEFAELGDYIDLPFRTYSSGMRARLLFAISMSIDPDILIVDEALATGDAYFVQKSSRRIRELCRSGATILFVSHNLSQIQEICQRVLFMAEGRVVGDGEPSQVVAAYNRWVFEKEKTIPLIKEEGGLKMTGGSGEVAITAVKLKNQQGEETTGFYSGEDMEVEIYYRSQFDRTRHLHLFVGFLLAQSGSYVGEFNTINYIEPGGGRIRKARVDIHRAGMIKLSFEPLLLLNNHYSLWIILYDQGKYYCEYKNISPFFVARRSNPLMRHDAIYWQPCRIRSISYEACNFHSV
ncbi:MAG: ABC transporter ATP-binding protein [candidate division NC10 bacterium]|nr:ABC transporter ATP-binding protein [candidate division NC10 bacterium]